MVEYRALCEELRALCAGIDDETANLANAAALIYHTLPDLNWAGFYRVRGDVLLLAPFQGKPACVKIPFGRGVCGRAWQEGRTQRVENVRLFPGHIACDVASASELVVPVFCGGAVWGVLDLDSPKIGRFTAEEEAGLESFVRVLAELLWPPRPNA